MKKTLKQIRKQYQNRYVEFIRQFDYNTKSYLYEVIKTSKTIGENMTLGQDIETSLEYCR